MRETLERYYELKSKPNLTAEEAEEFARVKRNIYYFYGQIRNIVEENKCLNLSPDGIRKKITDHHYEMIKKYYGLEKKEIDQFISSIHTPGSKKSI